LFFKKHFMKIIEVIIPKKIKSVKSFFKNLDIKIYIICFSFSLFVFLVIAFNISHSNSETFNYTGITINKIRSNNGHCIDFGEKDFFTLDNLLYNSFIIGNKYKVEYRKSYIFGKDFITKKKLMMEHENIILGNGKTIRLMEVEQ